MKNYKLCKGSQPISQPIHQRSKSELCKTSLLLIRQNIPKCKIEFLLLENTIWHRLMNTNLWLFYTKSELCTITCFNNMQSSKTEIIGVGKMTMSPNCEVHTENSVHLPLHSANTNVVLDLVHGNPNVSSLHLLTEPLKSVIPRNLINVKMIRAFIDLAKKAIDVREFKLKEVEP